MKEAVIVIPVYKTELDCVEQISLKRLWEVMKTGKTDMTFVTPTGLDMTNYFSILPSEAVKHFNQVEFDTHFFQNTQTYSELCCTYDFYNSFSNYKYMLIYQLDCYLFYDAIHEWCEKNYDYIGGPILSTNCGWTTIQQTQKGVEWRPIVGNGGFSLRKIETFKELTDLNGQFCKMFNITDELIKKIPFEDKYFCNDLYNYYALDVPDWLEAMHFSVDMSVDVIYDYYKLNPNPMGAHSIDKNIRYWKKHIPEFADEKVIEYCENKHKDFFKVYYDENDSTIRLPKNTNK